MYLKKKVDKGTASRSLLLYCFKRTACLVVGREGRRVFSLGLGSRFSVSEGFWIFGQFWVFRRESRGSCWILRVPEELPKSEAPSGSGGWEVAKGLLVRLYLLSKNVENTLRKVRIPTKGQNHDSEAAPAGGESHPRGILYKSNAPPAQK